MTCHIAVPRTCRRPSLLVIAESGGFGETKDPGPFLVIQTFVARLLVRD